LLDGRRGNIGGGQIDRLLHDQANVVAVVLEDQAHGAGLRRWLGVTHGADSLLHVEKPVAIDWDVNEQYGTTV
jgi:hypothetical protein